MSAVTDLPGMLNNMAVDPYIEHENSTPVIRWVKSLDATYGSKKPHKQVSIPFPEDQLSRFIACAYAHLYSAVNEKTNILIGHVNFVITTGDPSIRQGRCLDGGYLYFGNENNYENRRISLFLNSINNYDADKLSGLAKCIAECNTYAEKFFQPMPPIFELYQPPDTSNKNQAHSEKYLLDHLQREPFRIAKHLVQALIASDGIVKPRLHAIVINLRSIHDICDKGNASNSEQSCRNLFYSVQTKDQIAQKLYSLDFDVFTSSKKKAASSFSVSVPCLLRLFKS